MSTPVHVSVIVPNYNHGHFLNQRIDTILNQTYKNFELIILDDCSSDNSKDIINKYKEHSKVSQIVFNTRNSGSTFKQWEKGIKLAKGDYVWIAESDDWCEPTLLEDLIAGMDKETVLSYCQSLVIADGRIMWNSNNDFLEQHINGKEFIESKMLLGNSIFNASMCIFKKTQFYKITNDFTNYKFCGDWLFWIEIALYGNSSVFISGKILNYFRKHDKDVSNLAYKNGTAYFEYFDFLDSLERKDIISNSKKKSLLLKKFKELLDDHRLDKNVFKILKKRFKEVPYLQKFIELLKYKLKKII